MAAKSCCKVSTVTGELWLEEVELVLVEFPDELLVELVDEAGEEFAVDEVLEVLPKID